MYITGRLAMECNFERLTEDLVNIILRTKARPAQEKDLIALPDELSDADGASTTKRRSTVPG